MLLALVFVYNFCIYQGIVFLKGPENPVTGEYWILPSPIIKLQLSLLGLFVFGFLFAYLKQLFAYRSEPLSIVYELGGISLNDRATQLNSNEKKLLNIVEEMCIAAGIPVVPVYVLKEEHAINAFTAGHDFSTAYIVVTQGALDQLSRDELQAVIAHEVGHIVSADVSVNSVLLSCIAALTFLMTIGLKIIELMGRSRSRSSKDGNPLPFLAVAVLFIVLGFIGAFLGRCLQSLFSRKREFLADGLGVQFTRNPSSLASALAKIRDLFQSEIHKAGSMNIAHMCIANPLKKGFFSELMASHPPINSRIELLDSKYLNPEFNIQSNKNNELTSDQKGSLKNKQGQFVIDQSNIIEGLLISQPIVSEKIVTERLKLLEQINVSEQLHSISEFRYGVWSLLISKDNKVKDKQIEILNQLYGREFEINKITNIDLDAQQKLEISTPVFSIAIHQFKKISADERSLFVKSLKQLSDADSRLSDFELILLASFLVATETSKFNKLKINAIAIRKIISIFVKLSHSEKDHLIIYNQSLQAYYGKSVNLSGDKIETVDFDDLVSLIRGIKNSSIDLKQHLCGAILVALKHDKILTLKEVEAFRIFSIVIGIPSPPVLS